MMMKLMKFMAILLTVGILHSCNDWLDVKPRTQKEKEDFYSSESGFRGGLTGLYLKLKGQGLYGRNLTMTYIETMAQLWAAQDETQRAFSDFDWESTYVESVRDSWYSGLYNIIAQANDFLEMLEKNGDVIKSENCRNMMKGEALAIRAFCHFDILRLFGQVPQNATITRTLPYSDVFGEHEVKFLEFETYKEKVLRDFADASALLKASDPIVNYSYAALNNPENAIETGIIESDFEAYRRIRFNYWGVKALQARAYLYFGDKENAYICAKEVIDATLPSGEKVIDFSFQEDYEKNYYALSNETLIALNIYNINDYIPGLFATQNSEIYYKFTEESHLINHFFAMGTADYRISQWTNLRNSNGNRYTIKKYWQTTNGTDEAGTALDMNRQMVPLIRLAEVYLIAIETADATEAEKLFQTFKQSRNRDYTGDMTNNTLSEELLNEYRRELYGEGQMFFTYKRLCSKDMWDVNVAGTVYQKEVKEENYLLPIPKTEIEY